MAKLLSKEELKELTGYTDGNKIKKVLTCQGIGFVTDRNGRVKTTWDAVNAVLIHDQTIAGPNFEALNG